MDQRSSPYSSTTTIFRCIRQFPLVLEELSQPKESTMHLNKIEMPCINEDQIRELMQTEKLPNNSHPKEDEKVLLRGMVQMVLRRGDGSGLYVAHENLITTKGFDLVCDVLGKNAQPDDLSHIGIGTGTTAAAAAQTALVTQNAREIAAYAHVAGNKGIHYGCDLCSWHGYWSGD